MTPYAQDLGTISQGMTVWAPGGEETHPSLELEGAGCLPWWGGPWGSTCRQQATGYRTALGKVSGSVGLTSCSRAEDHVQGLCAGMEGAVGATLP